MARYSRDYINLIEESKRYSTDNKKAYGRCILEEKDSGSKIVVNVENLIDDKYYVYLLLSQHGQFIAVPLDKLNNKLELKKQNTGVFINDSKFLIKDVLAVMVGVLENKKVIPVLIGYRKDKINYKGNFYVYNKSNKKEPKEEDAVKNKEVTIKYKNEKTKIEEAKIEEIKEIKDLKEEKPIIKNLNAVSKEEEVVKDKEVVKEYPKDKAYKEDKENLKENIKEEANINEAKNSKDENAKANDFFTELFSNENVTNENIFSNMLTRFKEEIDEIKYISEVSNNEFARVNNNILQVDLSKEDGNIQYIFNHNNEIKPFSKQNKKVEWVTIDLKELTVISNRCWELRRNSLTLQGYSEFGHLILGKYDDSKSNSRNYLIGIPSHYDENNIEIAKEIGAVQYKPCDNPQLLNSVPGYWIIIRRK